MTIDRDRDASGRPHNARPRDVLGRPLDRDAVGGVVEPDPPALPPDEAIDLAQTLLDEGRAFRAHEVFEGVWKSATDDAELWRALAQFAVGITHAQRGNDRGSLALLTRAADNLAPWSGTTPYGIDIDALRSWASAPTSQPPPLRG